MRDVVVIRDYLGLWRTDFDERPSEHVLIYSGSDGLNERSWKILRQKIWPEQGRVSWSDFGKKIGFFGFLKFEHGFRLVDTCDQP